MFFNSRNKAHLLITLVFLCVSLSLFEPVMSWILILVVCAVTMRIALYLQFQKHAPSIRTLNLLALLSAIVLAYFSWQLGILLGMLNLLVLACGLKLMLLRSDKDYYQLVTSCGFLLGCGFIFQQSMGFSVVYLLLTLLMVLSLAFQISPSMALSTLTKKVLVMGLQALPIALLLFLVLPQIGPLWQMPSSKSHQTGLAEKITPGDIANLSQNSDLAFRVTFESAIPPPSQRYWRAIVMEHFDGKSWQVAAERKAIQRQYQRYNREFDPELSGSYYEFDVIAQPTHQNWLYTLDIGQPIGDASQRKIWQSHEYQLFSQTPLVSTFQYRLRSYPNVPLNQTLFSVDNRINKQLPQQGNPQTRQWVAQLRESNTKDEEFIQQVQSYFRQQPFVYTLQPPLMPDNPVDAFLFEQQRGFCSHYASAMAYALRLGGIPARVVAGYQGGEMRQQQYLSVYQYDAHAWVEAWHSEQGWVRYDPTAIVAPDRVQYGLRTALSEANELIDSPFSLGRYSSVAWLNEFRLLLADLDYFWTKWVLGFDQEKQQDLIKSFIGELTPKKLAIFGLSVVGLIAILLAIFLLPSLAKPKTDKARLYYQKALTLLATIDYTRSASAGPVAYAQSLEGRVPPPVLEPFQRLTDLYVSYYFRTTDAAQKSQVNIDMKLSLKQLKRAISTMKRHSRN